MRIALAQINPTVGHFSGNVSKIKQNIYKASKNDVDVVIFSELAICGYPPEDLLYKRHFVEEGLKALEKIVQATKNIVVIVGFVDLDEKGCIYNAAAVINNQKLCGVYRKEQLPNYGVFDEQRYFTKGTRNKIFAIKNKFVGVNICEDIWLDKGPHVAQAKAGAKLLINISGSPYNVGKLTEREDLLKKRAKQTKAYVAYVNMVGGQDELVFDGGSLVVNPQGEVIHYAKQFEEDFLICDLAMPVRRKPAKNVKYVTTGRVTHVGAKPKKISRKKGKRYNSLERVYQALVLGTRDYIRKNGFQKVVIGLSGGIDSSLVAAIAVDAIGKDNVIGVTMPSRYTSKGTKSDAVKQAKNLGMECLTIPIEKTFKAYLQALEPCFDGLRPNIAEENIQARIRGNLLMALSNKFGWMVLTTGNKSEFAVGYCTLYGDMSGGFAVIKDVPKTKVYELCQLINSKGKEIIPNSVIERPPSAELREDQKDEDSLPPYDDLDIILKRYVQEHQSFADILKGQKVEDVKRIIQLIDRNEYKRRQSPPGVKITHRAFGKDWRLPITNQYKQF